MKPVTRSSTRTRRSIEESNDGETRFREALRKASLTRDLDHHGSHIIELISAAAKIAGGVVERVDDLARGVVAIRADGVDGAVDPEHRFIDRARLNDAIGKQQDQIAWLE